VTVAPLVVPADLQDFPGAPFSIGRLTAAAEGLRREAGWHIAPVITETVVVESHGGCDLVLPTRKLLAVTAVASRWLTSSVPDWEVYPNGTVYRRFGWPVGRFEVTMTHGYDSCPPDLFPVLAQRSFSGNRDPSVSSVSVGNIQTSFRDPSLVGGGDAVSRYSVRLGIG
jgi:hypothetical protein